MHIDLPPTPLAPSLARRALSEMEDVLGDELDTVSLLATELVTNAVRHSCATEERPICLCTEIDSHRIRVEVKDPGPRFAPSAYEEDTLNESGRGLFLVEQISDRWGIEHLDGNKVWFELSVAPQARGA